MAENGQEQSVTSPKSRTFERLVLRCKRPLVVWASMAIPRPKPPLANRASYDCCESLTGRCRQNPPSGSFLNYQGAGHDTEETFTIYRLTSPLRPKQSLMIG